jgi:hypothetical protein
LRGRLNDLLPHDRPEPGPIKRRFQKKNTMSRLNWFAIFSPSREAIARRRAGCQTGCRNSNNTDAFGANRLTQFWHRRLSEPLSAGRRTIFAWK